MNFEHRAPETPICKTAGDETQPCPFARICGETRQRIQSGYHWMSGAWMQREAPAWGNACCHYGHLATDSRTAHLLRAVVAPDEEVA